MKMMRYIDTENIFATPIDIFYETPEDRVFLEALLDIIRHHTVETARFYWESGNDDFELFRTANQALWLRGLGCSAKWYHISTMMLSYSIDTLYKEERNRTAVGLQFLEWKNIVMDLGRMYEDVEHTLAHHDNPIFVLDGKFYQPLWWIGPDNVYAYRELSLDDTQQIFHISTINSGEKLATLEVDIPWSDTIHTEYERYLDDKFNDTLASEISVML